MKPFSFGQPDGAIVQLAYTVADIQQAMRDYTAILGAGPWFVLGPFTPPLAKWRGQPCAMEITIAFAFVGHVQIELLQQHNDVPSGFNSRPLGFHHWGIGTRNFSAAVAQREQQGCEVVFTDQLPDGAHIAYVDTTRILPAFVEFIEMTPPQEAAFTMMYKAAQSWDGSDPVRRFDLPAAG